MAHIVSREGEKKGMELYGVGGVKKVRRNDSGEIVTRIYYMKKENPKVYDLDK